MTRARGHCTLVNVYKKKKTLSIVNACVKGKASAVLLMDTVRLLNYIYHLRHYFEWSVLYEEIGFYMAFVYCFPSLLEMFHSFKDVTIAGE